MFSLEVFTKGVLKKLKERLGYKYDIQIKEIEKNNNVKKLAILAAEHGKRNSVVVYMEDYYEEYVNGVSLEQIIYSISSFIQSNHIEINVEEILDYEKMKDKLFFRLINYEANKVSLRNVPHIRYLDLSIIFCLSFKGDGYMTVTINNKLMEIWEKSIKELYEQAKKNTQSLFGMSFKTMNEVLIELAKEKLKDEQEIDKVNKLLAEEEFNILHVLTNKKCINGSAVILYDGVLKEISEELGSDLIIFPSSIHEVLILAFREDLSMSELKEMVHNVNKSEVPIVDILSDNVYRYSRKDDKVYIVTED